MNAIHTFALVVCAYLVTFAQAYFSGVRNWLGAQPDLMPVLVIYCGLNMGLVPLSLTSLLGGLWFDTLSENPVGISVLPLFVIGLAVYKMRDVVLREEPYARFLLGLAGCALAPFLTVLLLWLCGHKPLIGWGTLWQWLVLAFVGGAVTPVCFAFFDRVKTALSYARTPETSFRPDREIKRGRV